MSARVAATLLTVALGSTMALGASIEADIPFEFVVGEKTLPAAAYIFETASDIGPSVLRIRAKASGDRTMVDTDQMPEKEDSKAVELVFDRVGDKVYLMEIWGVTDSGRGVKHTVDGRPLKRGSDESRQRVAAARIVDPRGK